MESSQLENAQEATSNSCPEVVTVCLQTSVIVRKILQHMDHIELLKKISYVNKLWNHEARSVVRDRGCLAANLSSLHPCQQLAAFASDLRSMNVVPYAGINLMPMIPCSAACGCLALPAGGLDPSLEVILHRLRWKILVVSFRHYEDSNKNCPAFLLMGKILQDFGGLIELFGLGMDLKRKEFFEQILQGCKFSRLRVLLMQDGIMPVHPDYASLIKRLISRAPRLQELHFPGHLDFTGDLLEGSSAMLLPLYEISPTVDEISENFANALRVKWMKLREIRQDFSMSSISRTTSTILGASRTTLTSLHIDLLFLAPLHCYGICLDNVVDLMLCFNISQRVARRVSMLTRDFDFTRIFPSLTKVDVFLYSQLNPILGDQILEMVELCYPTVSEPVLDRAKNITTLRLQLAQNLIDMDTNRARLFHFLFPRIENFSVWTFGGDLIPRFLWTHPWANLKDLEIIKVGRNASRNQNFDSVFCGIFPQEVAELREKDDEYLKAVNIVSVMPSFGCFKGLRSFTFSGDSGCLARRGENPTPDVVPAEMFSKVTGLVAFKRYPGVSVTLKTDDAETKRELDHMQAYVNVVLGRNCPH